MPTRGPAPLHDFKITDFTIFDFKIPNQLGASPSRYPLPEVIPYAAAKAGLVAMTQAFAHSWGTKVRVNAILPGSFLTDISKAWDADAFAAEADRYAMKRGGRPDEIVGAALYLASDASSFTTGASLDVDGGYRP